MVRDGQGDQPGASPSGRAVSAPMSVGDTAGSTADAGTGAATAEAGTGAATAEAGTAAAYRRCEAITRAAAANFYYGIRLLPPSRRRAMCAVYAFARRVDDIGDGELPRDEKLRRLRDESAALARDEPAHDDPVQLALADARERYSLPAAALTELIEGVRMDVDGVAYERFEDLLVYCRRVAGGIGRLCLAIFRTRSQGAAEHAEALADELGVALQLTNILRDLREDAQRGRVYVPGEDLRRFGLLAEGETPGSSDLLDALAAGTRRAAGGVPLDPRGTSQEGLEGRLCELVRFEAQRAQLWFERGIGLAGMLDRRSAACVLAMAGIYRRLLDRIEARPERVLVERVSLPAWEKVFLAAAGVIGGDRRQRPRGSAATGAAVGGNS
jgi:15-cis-phytoene synthase